MANNYFANQKPTDITIQSEDGGGLLFDTQGKYVFGAKLPEINQQLNEEFYQGNVDIDPNTNSSYIAIMNEQSIPVNVDIPSTNQYSLFTPPENIIIEPNNQQNIETTPILSITITPSVTPIVTPLPTPIPSRTAQEIEEGIYDANFLPASENEGFQLFEYIIFPEVVTIPIVPSDLITTKEEALNNYTGPKNPTTNKGGKLVLNVGILKGADGDVNQEIHLPHPDRKGKEIADGYRGKIPVKQVTWNSNLISYSDIIAGLKRIGLTEDQARSCFALTGAEASRKGSNKGYFAGYNWNIFGLQAEGVWRESVSKYISYRYIAQDSKDNINTGETNSLRIFAGYENIDNALASKAEGMSFKGLLDITSPEDWAKKYRCTWVASGCNDTAILTNAANIYKTWGIRIFNESNKSY